MWRGTNKPNWPTAFNLYIYIMYMYLFLTFILDELKAKILQITGHVIVQCSAVGPQKGSGLMTNTRSEPADLRKVGSVPEHGHNAMPRVGPFGFELC